MEAIDLRVLRSIPTPIADVLLSHGCRSAGDVLSRPDLMPEALEKLQVSDAKRKASVMLGSCQREVTDSWGSANSALELLKQAQMQQPVMLPCDGLNNILGNALRPGGAILELCGLPGTGKTQFCMQLCAAAQIPLMAGSNGGTIESLNEAVYIDAEGSFTPERYAQICKPLLRERGFSSESACALEAVLRKMHVCRTYDAAEMYATVKHLESFLKSHRRVRSIVIDSIAFCFRHEFADNIVQRARVLTDIAATLRRYGAENNLVAVVTNHMTTKFDRATVDGVGWLAPALGETWAHQPSTQLRFERQSAFPGSAPVGRATLTKSTEQAVGQRCSFFITEAGVRDADSGQV